MRSSRKIRILWLMLCIVLFTLGMLMSKIQSRMMAINEFNTENFTSAAEQLAAISEVRVLCWIMTSPMNHRTKAIHVKKTWGKRCDTLLFISSANDTELPAVAVTDGKEGRKYLWHKTQAAYKLIYEQYLDKADWFMRADDDSYIVMENLKFLLKDYDPNESLYLGQRFKPVAEKGFMGGGAGFVLSKKAVSLFVEQALPENTENCRTNDYTSEDDVWIGDCMADVGVTIVDTRDALGRERFNQLSPQQLLNNDIPHWFPEYLFYPQKSGFNCCSEALISFHYVEPKEMYILEFLIYHVKVFGMKKNYVNWSAIGKEMSRTLSEIDE